MSNQCLFCFGVADTSWSLSSDDAGSCSVDKSSVLDSSEDIKSAVRTGRTFSLIIHRQVSEID